MEQKTFDVLKCPKQVGACELLQSFENRDAAEAFKRLKEEELDQTSCRAIVKCCG